MKKLIPFTAILILSLLINACGGGGSSEPTKGDAIVYVGAPLSGFQANSGQAVLGGVRLAAEQINRSGGLLGYKVVVRALDDESDNDVALSKVDEVQAAIDRGERVVGLVGHLNSGQTLAVMERYQKMPLVILTPTASEQSLTARGYTNFFRVNANDGVQAAVDANFLVNTLRARNIAVVHNDSPYGRGLADSLSQEIKKEGAAVAIQIEVKEAQSRFANEVKQIVAAAPDAVFYAGYEIEAPYLRAELVEAGSQAPMLASDGAFLGATIDEANGKAEGMYVSAFAPSPRSVTDASWFEAYQAVEYRNPDTFSVNGYLALQVMAEGAKKADSINGPEIASALRGSTFKTLLNNLTYDEKGDLSNPQIWIYQVKDGEFQQVK